MTELHEIIGNLSFEEKGDTLLKVSNEFLKKIRRGKRFRGNILIMIDDKNVFITSTEDVQGGLNSIGTVGQITSEKALSLVAETVENEYKQTIDTLKADWTVR